jgi:hypothetical protein
VKRQHLASERPFVFKCGERWFIEFVIDGKLTHWWTTLWNDAILFALNVARLGREGLLA